MSNSIALKTSGNVAFLLTTCPVMNSFTVTLLWRMFAQYAEPVHTIVYQFSNDISSLVHSQLYGDLFM